MKANILERWRWRRRARSGGMLSLGGLAGLGLGVALFYWLDPDSGRRRRAHVRDQLRHLRVTTLRAVNVTRSDLRHRARGLAARLRGLGRRFAPVADEVLVERVRSRLGRIARYPHAIEVHAHDGRVILSGRILGSEIVPLLREIGHVPGAREVESQLQARSSIEDLVGGREEGGLRAGGLRASPAHWTPAARLLAGLLGGGLVAAGRALSGPLRALAMGSGVALGVKAVTDVDLGRLARELRGDGPAAAAGDGHRRSPAQGGKARREPGVAEAEDLPPEY
jgi:hypothetical protein